MDIAELKQRLTHEPDALPLPESFLNKGVAPDYALVDAALEWQQLSEQHYLICFDDPLYPPLLKQISDPPSVLFVKGNIDSLLRPSIAVVGSRNATPGG